MNAPVAITENVLGQTLPASDAVARLWAALDAHVKLRTSVPARTERLVMAGEPKMAQKIVEEAGEVAVAAVMKDHAEVVRESADLIYHLTVLWAQLGIRPEEIWAEMTVREGSYGLAEKRAKRRHQL
jgi:phosphoribosyl-ATP pyrophosphohydrolase